MALNHCPHNADNAFGPIISPSCRPGFDFTLMFEQSILSIVPSTILLICVPFRLYTLREFNTKTSPNYMHALKLVTNISFAIVQLTLLVLWSIDELHLTPASIPSAALSFVVSIAICYLSYVEHNRSIRPSTLLNFYLLLSLILDTVQARTLFLRNFSIIASVFVTGVGLKLVLLILEAQAKISYLKPPYRHLSPEETCGVIDRYLFLWINPLLIVGYKRLLVYEDLPSLDYQLSSERLRSKMEVAWNERDKPELKYSLLFTVLRCLQWPFISVFFPRTCLIALRFTQPFLISTTISYVSQQYDQPENVDISYGLIAAAVFIYTGIAIFTASYRHYINRLIAMFRGALVGLIYDRSLLLQDGAHEASAAITLMSTDVDIICEAVTTVHEIWAQVIEITIGLGLLMRQLGWVSLIPFLIVASCSQISKRVSRKIVSRRKNWTGAVQRRIAMVSSMLGSIKTLKMMGLSNIIQANIQAQRIREIDLSKKFRWMVVLLNTIGNIVPIFAPAATFIIYAIQAKLRGMDPLSTNLAFTSLALLSMITGPATRLLVITSSLASATACFDRLQKFLLDPSREDQRRGREKSPDALNGMNIMSRESQSSQSPLVDFTAAILIDQVTVRYSLAADAALINICMRLETSSITMIFGPIGSGKSTLLKAVLGELPFEGDIFVSSRRMAYCAQTPWLVNESIRKNICGFAEESTIDELWYQTVLKACALDEDIQSLSDGDKSVIGSRGLSISGGQKQRLALARAIYSRLEIVLLDDVLSALDSKTESIVVERLFGPTGLFRKFGTTVIMVTHATQHFYLADHILVLGSDGKVTQQGAYDSLRSQQGYISSIIYTSAPSHNHSSTTSDQKPKSKILRPSDVVDLTRKTGDMSIYSYWLKSVSPVSAVAFISCAGAYSLFLAFSQYWLKWWTDDNGSNMIKYTSIYILLSLGASLFEAIAISWVLILIGPKSGARLHYTLLKTVMRAPLSFFAENDSGVTLNRFSQDIPLIDRVLPISAMNVVIQSFKILAQGILLFSAEVFMTSTIPFCLLVIFIIQRIYLQTSRQLRFLDLEYRSPVYSQFLETLEGLSTIRAFGWEEYSRETNIKRLDISQQPYYLMFCIQRWLNLTLDLIIAALAVILISLAVKLRNTNGGQIGIALNVVLLFNAILLRLIETWTQMETALGAISRLRSLETHTISEDRQVEDFVPPGKWPERGSVEFRNVTATYGSETVALKNISMTISPGQKLGICGRTGSGKSSLLLSLLRLLEINSGTIFIDGYDLQTIPRELIRNRLIAIPQDPFILNDSIRMNMDPSQSIPDARITEALVKVNLWTIISNRGGLDENMKLQPLSQGQQQLFCLARAMLRDSKILILDEATSNLDADTDKRIQKTIREEFKQHTVITVAHRIESIMDSDVIAVLDKGVLVEMGTPEELLSKDSAFRELHNK